MAPAELILETATSPDDAGCSRCPSAFALAPPPHQRLLSLDFLRGFTMFWIIGGSEFVVAIVGCIHPPLADAVETQLTHARWNGFTA